MQEFYINKNSLNPVLRMELINNGCYDFNKNNLLINILHMEVSTARGYIMALMVFIFFNDIKNIFFTPSMISHCYNINSHVN